MNPKLLDNLTIGSYSVDAVDYSTLGGASVGLVLYLLSTYVFHGHVPDAVSAFVLIIVPALVARIASKLTRSNTQPPPAPQPAPAKQGAEGLGG